MKRVLAIGLLAMSSYGVSAQVVKVYRNGSAVAEYRAEKLDSITFKAGTAQAPETNSQKVKAKSAKSTAQKHESPAAPKQKGKRRRYNSKSAK